MSFQLDFGWAGRDNVKSCCCFVIDILHEEELHSVASDINMAPMS